MNPDNFQNAWQEQPRPILDADLILSEVQRKDQRFAAMIFWRDFREIGVALVLVPLWLYLGIKNSSPWTWFLTVPVLLWVAGFMLTDRLRHQRRPFEPDEPLKSRVEGLLKDVDHQIWLLRNVQWWALLPLALAMLAFVGQVAWRERSGGPWMMLPLGMVVTLGVGVFAAIYWLNRYAVQSELIPRRRELETLRMSFEDDSPSTI